VMMKSSEDADFVLGVAGTDSASALP
jgi:hypothetical protein